MNDIQSWTPEQAWVIYQWFEQIREQILQTHHETILYYQWRERRITEYAEDLERMTQAERSEIGVWLEPEDLDDSSDLDAPPLF